MDEWKEKIIFHIHKFMGKDETKNAAAAQESCKSFDESKDAITKELEEKKVELKHKVIQIYEASSKEVKTLIKDPKGHTLKKHSAKVVKFLEELVKIDFPGSKEAYEASSKYGTVLAQDPVIFVFIKVSTFIVTEEVPSPSTTIQSRDILNLFDKVADAPSHTTSTEGPTKEPPLTTIETREIISVKEEPPLTAIKTKEIIVEKVEETKEELTKEAKAPPPPTTLTEATTKEPPVTDIKAKEIIVEKKESPKAEEKKEDFTKEVKAPTPPTTTTETSTIEPPVTAVKPKEIIVEKVAAEKEPPKAEERKEDFSKEVKTPPPPTPTTSTETSTKEPPVTAVKPQEIIVQKVADEKEPPKTEDKKEGPTKT